MNAVEFVTVCKLGSYCDRKTAERYISECARSDYTADDCIAAYRMGAGREPIRMHGSIIGNGYYADGNWSQGFTTKRYPHGDSGRREQN